MPASSRLNSQTGLFLATLLAYTSIQKMEAKLMLNIKSIRTECFMKINVRLPMNYRHMSPLWAFKWNGMEARCP
jgi:hypothetical protein